MRINLRKKKNLTDEQLEIISTKDFFDRTVPGIIKFYTDHYICGNFYKSCWAVTEYPTSTEETAILAHLADRNGVTLRIYNRLVTSMEQRKIVQQAMRKNHMMTTTNDVNESIKAQDNINDVVELLSELRRNKEPRPGLKLYHSTHVIIPFFVCQPGDPGWLYHPADPPRHGNGIPRGQKSKSFIIRPD